jgi:uncharacterized protein (TIGR02145 family)
MKKIISLILGIALVYGCSTSTDGNGNTTAVPVPPSNLTGTVSSSTQINLSWTDNSTNETGFKIERKTGTGTYAVVGSTATDVTTYSDTGLTPSTTYTYRVYSYNSGGNSPTYSNEIDITTRNPTVTDFDGNTYEIVSICNQTWTKSNLNVSHYRNGDIIPQVTNLAQWSNLTTGAWCYYSNTSTFGTTYGKLYNWYAVNDPRGLAPIGFHIPSDAEWANLITCLGGNVAGGAMKETGTINWRSPNTGATNSSGFTALPGGLLDPVGQLFNYLSVNGYWWSTLESSSVAAWLYILSSNAAYTTRANSYKTNGLSVRCVKD